MKKIKSLFKRDYKGNRQVINEVVEGCEWVQRGEGTATRKWDGTCCKIEGGELFKRYDRKLTKSAMKKKKSGFTGPWVIEDFKPAPENWIAAQEPDKISGHWPGWLPVGNGPEDKYHREAMKDKLLDGTYELCGPKVNGNKDGWETHVLVRHGQTEFKPDPPRDFTGLKKWMNKNNVEGIVWHHPDGRMVKIKKKDFGLDW